MNIRTTKLKSVAVLLASASLTLPAFAQQTPLPWPVRQRRGASDSDKDSQSDAEMMKRWMEMSKLNDNHKLLGQSRRHWTYVVKMWMDGDTTKKPQESKGTAYA